MGSDYEVWIRFERAIADEARRQCSEACSDGNDGKGCALCTAEFEHDWRRDAINALRSIDSSLPKDFKP